MGPSPPDRVMNTEHINVLWDIENCAVPYDVAANQIAGHIRDSLASVNLHGPITLSAYGDVMRHSKDVQRALADTNIYFKNISNGEYKTVRDDEPYRKPPTNVFLMKQS